MEKWFTLLHILFLRSTRFPEPWGFKRSAADHEEDRRSTGSVATFILHQEQRRGSAGTILLLLFGFTIALYSNSPGAAGTRLRREGLSLFDYRLFCCRSLSLVRAQPHSARSAGPGCGEHRQAGITDPIVKDRLLTTLGQPERKLGPFLCLLLASMATVTLLTGCVSSRDFFAQAAKSYTLTIAATSGQMRTPRPSRSTNNSLKRDKNAKATRQYAPSVRSSCLRCVGESWTSQRPLCYSGTTKTNLPGAKTVLPHVRCRLSVERGAP